MIRRPPLCSVLSLPRGQHLAASKLRQVGSSSSERDLHGISMRWRRQSSACGSPRSFLFCTFVPSLFQLLSPVSCALGQLSILCVHSQDGRRCPCHLARTLSFLRHPRASPCCALAFTFLPHHLLQARGARCPEHPAGVMGPAGSPTSPSLAPILHPQRSCPAAAVHSQPHYPW